MTGEIHIPGKSSPIKLEEHTTADLLTALGNRLFVWSSYYNEGIYEIPEEHIEDILATNEADLTQETLPTVMNLLNAKYLKPGEVIQLQGGSFLQAT